MIINKCVTVTVKKDKNKVTLKKNKICQTRLDFFIIIIL